MASPPFFQVDGGGGGGGGGDGATLHFLGTVHVGPAEGWSFSDRLETAIAEAQSLVLEIDTRTLTEEASAKAVVQHGLLASGMRLSGILSAATLKGLELHDDRLGAIGAPAHTREWR